MKRAERYTSEDKEGIIAWAALATILQDKEIQDIEHRFAQIPGGKRDLSLMRSLANKYLYKIIQQLPIRTEKDGEQLKRIIHEMRVYTGIRGVPGHPMLDGAKDFGWYISLEDIDVLLEALSDRCLFCNKTKEQMRRCSLKAVLDKLPLADECEGWRWCDDYRYFD